MQRACNRGGWLAGTRTQKKAAGTSFIQFKGAWEHPCAPAWGWPPAQGPYRAACHAGHGSHSPDSCTPKATQFNNGLSIFKPLKFLSQYPSNYCFISQAYDQHWGASAQSWRGYDNVSIPVTAASAAPRPTYRSLGQKQNILKYGLKAEGGHHCVGLPEATSKMYGCSNVKLCHCKE
eukprot:1143328-Pelagomonas_calceolata.AAC.6